jgi:hypothetical protein
VTPRSAGRSRSRQSTRGTTASAANDTVSAAVRQPLLSDIRASTGRKISWPAAPPAVSTPVTRPRWRTNQRLVTVATNASAIEPVPNPTSTPQHSTSCQLAVISTVSPLPAATSNRAAVTTRRSPNLSISAAANGAVSPYSSRLTDTAAEIVPVDQPNSSCSGPIRTDGVARKPAAPTSATKATTATVQAGCTRVRGATRRFSGSKAGPASGRNVIMHQIPATVLRRGPPILELWLARKRTDRA